MTLNVNNPTPPEIELHMRHAARAVLVEFLLHLENAGV